MMQHAAAIDDAVGSAFAIESQKISMEFEEAPFEDVLDFVRITTEINVVVDPVIYQDRSREEFLVTLHVRDLTVRQALELVLELNRLTWSVKNGVMVITPLEARTLRFSPRVYDIRDLLFEVRDFPGPDISLTSPGDDGNLGAIFGDPPAIDELEPDMIVDILRENTGVGSWDQTDTGIQHAAGLLVVRQSSEVHREVHKMLNLLRSHK